MKRSERLECAVAPELVSVKQLSALLQLSPSAVYELRASGRLPEPVRLGGAVRWRRKEIECWILADCPPRHRWQEMKDEAHKKVLIDAARLPSLN